MLEAPKIGIVKFEFPVYVIFVCAVVKEEGYQQKPEASNTEISKRNPKLLTVRYERSHLAEFSHQQLSQPTVTDINKIS